MFCFTLSFDLLDFLYLMHYTHSGSAEELGKNLTRLIQVEFVDKPTGTIKEVEDNKLRAIGLLRR